MLLKKRTKNLLENQETGYCTDEHGGPEDEILETQPKKHPRRKGMNAKDRPQFKRKKAKGPNPLSVQKKKNRGNLISMSGKVSGSLFLNAFRLVVWYDVNYSLLDSSIQSREIVARNRTTDPLKLITVFEMRCESCPLQHGCLYYLSVWNSQWCRGADHS